MDRPVQNCGGSTLIVGNGIQMFQLLALKGAMGLEEKGLSSRFGRWGAHRRAMQMLGIPGKATAANRKKAFDGIVALCNRTESVVADECRTHDQRN